MDNKILELKNITKKFGGIKALNKVNISLNKGDIHALVGENGAGKSTLIKILTGVHKNDGGSIILNCSEINLKNPVDARKKGIVAIYQELSLIEELTVGENIFLGHEPIINEKFGITDRKKLYKKSKEYLERFDLDIDPEMPINELGMGQKRIIEILKAITIEAKILLLDEPTTGMSKAEIDKFFKIITRFKNKDLTMVYISHHLDQVFKLSDKITVLRNGKKIRTHNTNLVNKETLVEDMIGEKLENEFPHHDSKIKNKIKLEVNNLKTKEMIEKISFQLFSGEILGITGIIGSGKSELGRALIGFLSQQSGDLKVNDKKIKVNSPVEAKKHGIVYIPEDRKTQGLFLDLNVKDNLIIPNVEKTLLKYNFISNKLKEKLALSTAKKLNVKPLDTDMIAKNLSGGNQQKIVFGKWLMSEPQIMILDEPTKGIDIGAKKEIYTLINNLADKGVGIIILSSEFQEIKNLSDRILILRNGKITKKIESKNITEREILSSALGGQ